MSDSLPRLDTDALDIAALRAVYKANARDTAAVQACHDGPLPVQRLNGLKRRGLIDFKWGNWFVVAKGVDALRAAARTAADNEDTGQETPQMAGGQQVGP